MQYVTSADGTQIAFVSVGEGPPLILIPGALSDHTSRSAGVPLADKLRDRFRVIAFDRRGRGASGDTAPYAVARELEDVAALIAHVGGTASVYGMSSGAILALEAAASGLPITKLALYEPPYITDGRPKLAADYRARLAAHVADGRPGDAVAQFMTEAVGMPAQAVAGMKAAPFWPALAAFGASLLHDADLTGDGSLPPAAHFARATMSTLILDGGASPAWMRTSAQRLAAMLPNATHRTLPDQTHDVDPAVLAAALAEIFASSD